MTCNDKNLAVCVQRYFFFRIAEVLALNEAVGQTTSLTQLAQSFFCGSRPDRCQCMKIKFGI